MAEGFVYVLMNPAFPGYIKVGKTTKAPVDRAKELSAATGVPTPFVVAYDAFFADCDRAEQYVHSALEARGIARTPDREFFATNLREVIAVVMEAGRHLERSNTMSLQAVKAAVTPETPAWLEVLREAENYDYGMGDTLEDRERAIALYKQAARLGAPEAFTRLADLCADCGDAQEGVRWLTRGAESGVMECWAALALVYMGENLYFDLPPHPENARKAWRRFFRSVEPAEFDSDGSRLYAMLRRYVSIVHAGYLDTADTDTIHAFERRFAEALAGIPVEAERHGKLRELRTLIERVP